MSLTSLKLSRSHRSTATRRVGEAAPGEGVLYPVSEQHPVGQTGERVVESKVDKLDLTGPQRAHCVPHLVGKTKVFNSGEYLLGEQSGDDAQAGDHHEQVEVMRSLVFYGSYRA